MTQTYANIKPEDKERLYHLLGRRMSELLQLVREQTRVYAQLRSFSCDVKSVYWELPAFLAPQLGALAQDIKAVVDKLHGWLFLDELQHQSAEEKTAMSNLVRLTSLLHSFGNRIADGRLLCNDSSRSQFLNRLRASRLVPGPVKNVELVIEHYFGRSLDPKLLAALIGQTMSPGRVEEIEKSWVILSLDGPPSCRDLALGCLRLWPTAFSAAELWHKLRRLNLFQGSQLELEMELYGLQAEGLVEQVQGQFGVASQGPTLAREPEAREDVANLVFQSLFEVATSDGVLLPAEMTAIGNLMAVEFALDRSQIEPFESVLKLALQEDLGYRDLGESLADLGRFPQELRDKVFRSAVALAAVDREIHPREKAVLQSLAQRLQTALPATTVLARFEEINAAGNAGVEHAYFGILPDLSDPERVRAKLLGLDRHLQYQLRQDSPPTSADLLRAQQLLKSFDKTHGFAAPPWLLKVDLQNPSLPTEALLPLHCFLRIAKADGPLNASENQTIRKLVHLCLPKEGAQRSLWSLQPVDLSSLAQGNLPEIEHPPLRYLSLSLVVALCDGPLNVEKSRELLSIAADLGVAERSFQILHRLEQATREHLLHDPDLEDLTSLEKGLSQAEKITVTTPLEQIPHPLVLPHLQPGERPFLMVIRPSGRHSFVIHLRTQAELCDLPFMPERLQRAIEDRPLLQKMCAGRSWFLCKGVPQCMKVLQEVQEGPFEVIWPHGKPFTVLGKAGLHNLRATISQKHGWFEIGGKLQLGQGYELPLLDLLERVKASSDAIAIDSETYVQLSDDLMQQLLQIEAMLPEDLPRGTLDPLRARLLAGNSHLFEDLTNNQEFSRLGTLLEEARELQADVPEAAWNCLRDYQRDGVLWMLRTTHAGLGACLADDMGLGKTLQTLCLLYHRRDLGTSLVVAPTSVTYNWKEQAQRFLPQLKVLLYEGTTAARKPQWAQVAEHDLVVASYGIMQKDQALLQAYDWNCIVLDEAQKIKNPSSATARVAFGLPSRARIATTGTPIENHLLELWSLMNFLNPGLLGSQSSFREVYLKNGGDEQILQRLRGQVSHFILRRRKEAVAPQLPPKLETIYRIDLSSEERRLYNSIRRQALQVKSDDRISLLSALTRLRQVCCDPAILDREWSQSSSKVNTAVEMLGEIVAEGHQVLVFSQFVSLLKRVALQLDQEGLPYRELYGSTPVEERRHLVDEFQKGQFRIFLISLKAGGTGLTLTRAEYVIHLDPWWNPAVEDQATDRAHRIGQTRTVNVYRFIARETVEEKVLELHARKRELARAVLDQDGIPKILTVEDLRALI